jgi:hypothetical protein
MLVPSALQRFRRIRQTCRFLAVFFLVSTGLIDVQVANAQLVRISNLTYVTVPYWISGDPDIVHDLFVCVYRQNTSTPNRRYAIRAIGDGPGLFLKSGFHRIAYTAFWNDGGLGNPAGGNSAPLLNDVKLLARDNARINTDLPSNSTDCQGYSRPTARLRIVISRTALDAAYDGLYTGILVLVLTPD